MRKSDHPYLFENKAKLCFFSVFTLVSYALNISNLLGGNIGAFVRQLKIEYRESS